LYKESKTRSVLKSITWRLIATLTTTVLVYVFTGELAMAATVGGLELFAKLAIHFVYERAWAKIRFGVSEVQPAVLWFTGLSGSGKSTVAQLVFEKLKAKGYRLERLDGDRVRSVFPKTGFSREARETHIKRIGFVASLLEKNGVFVVASFISPHREPRDFVRKLCRHFIEIHISTPLEECEKRDRKGLYAKARAGEIKNFTGIDDPYEAPINPELRIDTTHLSVEEAADEVIRYVLKQVSKPKSGATPQIEMDPEYVAMEEHERADAEKEQAEARSLRPDVVASSPSPSV
jgi:adenylylsulfate kinase